MGKEPGELLELREGRWKLERKEQREKKAEV